MSNSLIITKKASDINKGTIFHSSYDYGSAAVVSLAHKRSQDDILNMVKDKGNLT